MKTLCLLLLTLSAPADYVQKHITNKKAGYYNANASYLVMNKNHALASVINPILKRNAEKENAEWVKETIKIQKEMGKPNTAWEHETGVEVYYHSPKLVSLLASTYDYSGGAHPNHLTKAMNFGLIDGKPRQLQLTDFFEKRFSCNAHITKLVMAKLRTLEGTDFVKNGDVKGLDKDQLQNFSVSPTALTWYFNPYEVGPYAAGDFEVKLTLKELGPKFKSSLLKK